jgi:hypothetical protein
MRRQFLWLVAAGLVGALGAQALQACLRPTPAFAGTTVGRLTQNDDGSMVISARNATLTLTPDGIVRVTAPEKVIIGTADDVKIEGYRVTIDASSELKVETSDVNIDVSDFKLDSNHIEIGDSSSDIKLADGDNPICLNDDGAVVKSDRVKSR